MARPAGFEPATLGLAYQLRLSTPRQGLWSGLSLHHLRCRTYSLYGSPGQAVINLSLTAYSGVFLPSIELSLQNTRADLPAAGSMLNTNQCTGQPMVSSGLPSALPVKVSPIQCNPLYELSFPIKAPVCTTSVLCA